MVSTVTTSTVTTAAVAGSLAIIGILVLLALLVQKEVVSARGSRYSKLDQALNIGILPLLIAFVLTVIIKVADVLH